MKTQDSSCNPSVTITVTCEQAMMIWHALSIAESTHQKRPRHGLSDCGKWGHYDCPPKYGQIQSIIKCAIHEKHPEIYENCFGDSMRGINSAPENPTVNTIGTRIEDA